MVVILTSVYVCVHVTTQTDTLPEQEGVGRGCADNGVVHVAPTPPSLTIIISAGAALALGPALTVPSSCCFPPD